MTRKQALYKAIELIEGVDHTQQGAECVSKLYEVIGELPFTKWSEETIHDTLHQFAIDTGRNPTTTDLKAASLPPHTVIKHRFGVTAKEFLELHYPPEGDSRRSPHYCSKDKYGWKENFISEYNRIKPSFAKVYNLSRQKSTPRWQFVSNMFGIKLWTEWLEHCDVKQYHKQEEHKKESKMLVSVRIHLSNEHRLLTLNENEVIAYDYEVTT